MGQNFVDGSKNENSQIQFSRMLTYHAEQEHNYPYFADFIFTDVRTTAKSTKILSHEISYYLV